MSLWLTGSDLWVRAGWTMLHYLWVGTLLGLGAGACIGSDFRFLPGECIEDRGLPGVGQPDQTDFHLFMYFIE